MLSAVSMEHFQKQIKEELSKLDKRFLNLKDTEVTMEPSSNPNHQAICKSELGCDVCPEFFMSTAQLILHQKTHTGQIPSICNFCLKSFALKENLVGHKCSKQQSIAPQAIYRRCEKCRKVISSADIVRHQCLTEEQQDTNSPALLSCKVCRKSYTNEKHLKLHMRCHSSQKPFSCQFCNKSFAYQHVLKLHQVQHYSSRVYQCSLCRITFPSKKDMETHIMKHDTMNNGFIQEHRPSSTGSASASSCTERSNSPAATRLRHMPFGSSKHCVLDMSAADLTKCSTADLILPSINSIYSDEDVKSMPQFPRSSPKISVVKHNPVFPITDSLIERLVSEDRKKFGHLKAVHVPSLNELVAGCNNRSSNKNSTTESQEEPMDLSKSPEPTFTPSEVSENEVRSPSPSVSSTFSSMEMTSLPPNKRRLASKDSNRFSVIQFALKNEI